MLRLFSSEPFLTTARLKILAVVLCLLTATWISTQPQTANDFWLQAKVGESIAATNKIPATLVYPFTEARDFAFNAHEWLPSLLFHGLLKSLGESALPLILGALGLVYFGLMYKIAALRSGDQTGVALLAAMLALLAENFRHLLRPELFALLICGGFLYNLERLVLRPHWSRWMFALMLAVLWANTHGSFVLAPLLVGLYALGGQLDHWRGITSAVEAPCGKPPALFGLALLCAGALLLNPFGWEQVRFALQFSSTDYIRAFVMEWFPALDSRLRHVLGVQLGLAIALALIVLSAGYARRLRSSDLLLLSLVLLLSLRANRFLVYLSYCLVLILPALAQSAWRPAQRAVVWSVCGVCAVVLLYASQFGNVNGNYPMRSHTWGQLSAPMQRLLEDPTLMGPAVYCSYDFGAELVYHAYPRLQPSIDSRIDSYGESYFARHEALLRNPAAMADFIQRYHVRLMLLTADDFNTMRIHRVLPPQAWRIYATDGQAVLLTAL